MRCDPTRFHRQAAMVLVDVALDNLQAVHSTVAASLLPLALQLSLPVDFQGACRQDLSMHRSKGSSLAAPSTSSR